MSETPLSNLFALLATANECPTPDTVHMYTSGQLGKDFRTVWGQLELPEDMLAPYLDALSTFEGKDDQEVLSVLRREYTRLFLTEGRLVFNCQGPWQNKKDGKEAVLFMVNPLSTEISDFMRYCGVVKADGYNDSMDMLENEWCFCSILASKPKGLEDKGIDPLEKLDEFIDTYMKAWVPDYAADVQKNTQVAYFDAFAQLQSNIIEMY